MRKEYFAVVLVVLLVVFTTEVDAGEKVHGYTRVIKSVLKKEIEDGYSLLTIDDLSEITKKHFQSKFIGETPGVVCGDFRGIGLLDCAAIITKEEEGRNELNLVYVQNATTQPSRKIVLRREASYKFTTGFLKLASKGSYPDRSAGEMVNVSKIGFEIVFFEKYSILFYWEKGKLQKVWTSD